MTCRARVGSLMIVYRLRTFSEVGLDGELLHPACSLSVFVFNMPSYCARQYACAHCSSRMALRRDQSGDCLADYAGRALCGIGLLLQYRLCFVYSEQSADHVRMPIVGIHCH